MSRSSVLMRRLGLVALIGFAAPAGAATPAKPAATGGAAASVAARPATPRTSSVSQPVTAKKSVVPARKTAPGTMPATAPPPPGDADEKLRGGQEGTVFRSLTVEGEDRIHYEVERPELRLELDPSKAPGLEWGTARDVLDRTIPDAMTPLLATSAREASPYTGRPWLSHFASGAVARFRPDVEGVERWKLTVANWRGQPVATFQGKGDPPREIAWDGRAANGGPVMPGATYSYVFEATDKAGNRRHFVGEGFRVSAFRLTNDQSSTLVFTASEMSDRGSVARGPGVPPAESASPVILEAASWLNQSGSITAPIVVTAIARSGDEATALAQRVQQQLGSLLIGEASRIRAESKVESDAPVGGAIALATGRAAMPVPARK